MTNIYLLVRFAASNKETKELNCDGSDMERVHRVDSEERSCGPKNVIDLDLIAIASVSN